MTPRPEDVALLRRLAMYRELEGRQLEAIRGDATVHYADAARLRALASRLEGEGRDGERLDWLDKQSVDGVQYVFGRMADGESCRYAIDAALQSAAPASSPQPTTTTEEHEP